MSSTIDVVRRIRDYARTPPAQRTAARRDRRDGLRADPGIAWCIDNGLQWLARAQDMSTSNDGGVARHYGIAGGWSSSYPETTGYIVPTVLEQARIRGDDRLSERARRMLDWLVRIQLPGGGFQGGTIGQTPVVPVTFNTGQILLGLAAGLQEFGDTYRKPLITAATWLVDTQDADGCWRKFPTPFAQQGEKSYETHVAWGLIEAERVAPGNGFADAALKNVRWALRHQQENGWFANCCLSDPSRPITHTIGYVLRGIVEVHGFFEDDWLLDSARLTADGLLGAIRPDGALPGKLDSGWRSAASWSCLTGNVQIAHSLLLLYERTGHVPYRDAAYQLNAFVRRTMRVDDQADTRGAVKGSFPIDGEYGKFQFLNWATKFAIDAYTMERRVRERDAVEMADTRADLS